MNKLKQLWVGMFIASTLFITQSVANDSKTIYFDGVVTLNSEIQNLMDTCSENECPVIQIEIQEKNVYKNVYATVIYNEEDEQYEYHTTLTQNIAATDDYAVTIRIMRGDMGYQENLYYDFGIDQIISVDDILRHDDETYDENHNSLVHPLTILQDETDIDLDIDLSLKNEGRQKIMGKIRLPDGITLGSRYDDNGEYIGSNNVWPSLWNIDTSKSIATQMAKLPDANGLYPFTANIKFDEQTATRVILTLGGELNGTKISTTYQIGEDVDDLDDHTIDGDEKLVSRPKDIVRDFTIFPNDIADYGMVDLKAYFVDAKTLNGSVVWPADLLVIAHDSSVTLTVGTEFGVLGKYQSRIGKNIEKPANVKHPFEINVPKDIQNQVLTFSIYLWSTNNQGGENGYRVTYKNAYNFGTDKQVGGTGDDLDHLNGPCEAPSNSNPLELDYSTALPVVDINLTNFVPVSSHAAIMILPIPTEVKDMNLSLVDMSCENGPIYTPFWYNEPMADGWYMNTYDALFTGHDYALVAEYSINNQKVSYVADTNDHNYTNGGVYLKEMKWIDNPNGANNQVLDTSFIQGGERIDFSPFEFIVPKKAISPSIVMYLLN